MVPRILHSETTLAETGRSRVLSAGDSLPALTMAGWPYTLYIRAYKDNRFLDDAAIRTLESFQETDEYYYQVYCLGMWGVTGKTVFDGKAVAARLQAAEAHGYF